MLFTKHERKLDYKGRLTVPDELLRSSERNWNSVVALANTATLPNQSQVTLLSLYDSFTWNLYLETAHQQITDLDEARMFMERTVGTATSLDLDAMNRLTFPASLIRHAGIDKLAMVLGVFDHVEVWNPSTYQSYVEALSDEIEVPSLADLARSRIREIPVAELRQAE